MSNRFMALFILFTKREQNTPLGEVLSEEWFEVPRVNEDFKHRILSMIINRS